MTAVLTRLRADLRGGWRSWVALAVLIGALSGIVFVAAIGARRTATAYPRFLEAARAEDILISPADTGMGEYYDVLRNHPDVEALAVLGGAPAATTAKPRSQGPRSPPSDSPIRPSGRA